MLAEVLLCVQKPYPCLLEKSWRFRGGKPQITDYCVSFTDSQADRFPLICSVFWGGRCNRSGSHAAVVQYVLHRIILEHSEARTALQREENTRGNSGKGSAWCLHDTRLAEACKQEALKSWENDSLCRNASELRSLAAAAACLTGSSGFACCQVLIPSTLSWLMLGQTTEPIYVCKVIEGWGRARDKEILRPFPVLSVLVGCCAI